MLIVDNQDDILLTKRALVRSAIANPLIVVTDGQDAIDYLARVSNTSPETDNSLPVLIMLDLRLPRVDGIEVLRHIRNSKHLQSIPVIVLTSSKEDVDIINSHELGINSYMHKPVNFTQFAEAVKNAGLFWLVLNKAPEESGINS